MTAGTVPGVAGPTPYNVAARDLLRTTLLDAVREELRHKSWAAIRMADVAKVAGVSRQTLYNEFGSRGDLAQAFVLREADLFLDAVQQAVLAHRDDPVAALAAAFEVFLTAAADDPLVRALLGGEGSEELLALVTTQGEPVLERATSRLGAFLQEGWPEIAPAKTTLLAETVVRLAISYAALPSGPASLTGTAIAELLGPFVREAVGQER